MSKMRLVSSQSGGNRPPDYHVLVVEDSKGDATLLKMILAQTDYVIAVDVVEDGDTAAEYIAKKDEFKDKHTPDLILLDLNLPRVDGRDFLRGLKADAQTCMIPVVIVSTSGAEHDVRECYEVGASGYVMKPVSLDEFATVIKGVCAYWFSHVRLIRRRP